MDGYQFVTYGIDQGLPALSGDDDHFIPLVSQGVFGSFQRSTANQKTLVFADETVQGIGGPLSGLNVIVDLTRGSSTGSAGVRVTLSGYIEDLPAPAAVR